MKTFLWIIVIAALVFGVLHFYRKYSRKPEVKTEQAAAPAVAPAPETSTAKPNSEKGIKNWRAIKKVRNLSDQHNKDLQNNM
ncbi:MAG: hypothetical protein PHV82_06200 [Victivallaceae bacterium]|nr:hypothetical protein [Victivallaceae bacterium]